MTIGEIGLKNIITKLNHMKSILDKIFATIYDSG